MDKQELIIEQLNEIEDNIDEDAVIITLLIGGKQIAKVFARTKWNDMMRYAGFTSDASAPIQAWAIESTDILDKYIDGTLEYC